MSRLIYFLAIVCVASACDSSESLKSTLNDYFLKYYGIEGDQFGVDFVSNPDGTFVLLGTSRKPPSENSQIYIIKIDAQGSIIWEKRVGGPNDEEAKDIELLPDGNLVLVGNSEVVRNGQRDVFVVRLTQAGAVIDSTRQGLKLPNGDDADDNANSITPITAGLFNPDGFIIAGTTTGSTGKSADLTDAMHIRLTNGLLRVTGNWQDRPTFGLGGFSYEGEDGAVKVIQYDRNSYYVFGYNNAKNTGTTTASDFDFWIYGRTDQGGSFGTPKYIGDSNNDEKLTFVSEAPISSGAGSGYILSGSKKGKTVGSAVSPYIVRLDKPISLTPDLAGVTINNSIQSPDFGSAVRLTAYNFTLSSGYFVTYNTTDATTTDSRIVLAKRDGTLNEVFTKLFDGVGDDFCGPVVELPDGKIAMIGTMTLGGASDGQKKIVFIKLNDKGLLSP